MSVEEIVQQVLSHRQGLACKKIMLAIEKKKAISGGFLTSEAAARLVAAELGVEIKLEKPLPKVYIRQLVSGLNDVTVSGRVLLVNKPKVFSKPNINGQVARLSIADKTGSVQIVLWNDKAELARNIKLRQIVKVLHGYVRQGRGGEMELHVGQRGDIQIAPSDAERSDFPSLTDFLEKISTVHEVRRKINVEGTIKTIYPASTFQQRDGTQGKVVRAVLEDETGLIPVVFWNEKAEEMENAKEGMTILLINVKVRKSRRNDLLELHVENFANIEILNCLANSLRIKDLKEGIRVAFIEGTVTTQPMLREVTTRRGEKVFVASFELMDETGKAWVSAWRKHAEKAGDLAVGLKVSLKDVYVRKGFGNQLEITTRVSSKIEVD